MTEKRQRRWGQGWVYKRRNRWWIGYSVGGKMYRESSHSERRQDAVDMLNDALEKRRKGRPLGPDVRKTTFVDLDAMLLTDYRTNKRRSLDRVERSLKHLREKFGGEIRDGDGNVVRKVTPWLALNITTDQIQEYVSERQAQKAQNATINRELAALKRMFRLAARARRVLEVPYVPMLREDNTRTGFFERAEFDAIVEHLPGNLKPVFTTAYATGWRVRSEILTRQWKHVDFRAGWLRLEPGEAKNREGRSFPLAPYPELRAILDRQREGTKEVERAKGEIIPWVFHRNGKPIKSFRRAWLTACEKAGLAGRIPHDFRRSAVRNLERAGVPRSTAMKLVGHKTESVYRRYAIVSEQDLTEGVAKLAALHQSEQGAVRKLVPLRQGR